MLITIAVVLYNRSRKRKMIVSTGEEVEIDVSGTEYVNTCVPTYKIDGETNVRIRWILMVWCS